MEIIKCMKNRILSLLLLLSGFVFGQNVELLKQLQRGSENLPEEFSKLIIPDYKVVEKSKAEPTIYYYYIPENSTDKEIKEYQISGGHKDLIKISYNVYGNRYILDSVMGDCDRLFSIWNKEIHDDGKLEKYKTYVYKQDNISYFFTNNGESRCSINNLKSRSLK